MKKLILFFISSLTLCFVSCSENEPTGNISVEQGEPTLLNLDFEEYTPDLKPSRWTVGGSGYYVLVDDKDPYSGNLCLRMKYQSGSNGFGVATSSFPIRDARGKNMKFTGYMRTADITDGWAGLWMRVDGRDSVLAFNNSQDLNIFGTTEWTQYQIEFYIDSLAEQIVFGALLPGNGTAWFDNFSFELDGLAYESEPVEEISVAQHNWLMENIETFETEEPESGFDDLQFLDQIIGGRKIVSLGEATHGTKEFFKMKHRMLEYLVHEKGFTHFAIEANMPECRAINNYVLNGEGDAKEALAGIYFWTWNTQEVLDMIQWMRQYNLTASRKIQFLGFDMQFPDTAMAFVKRFIQEVEPSYLPTLTSNFENIHQIYLDRRAGYNDSSITPNYELWESLATSILEHMIDKKNNYLSLKTRMEVEWAIQDARVILQCATSNIRDQHMADNVKWILDNSEPDSKIVLWAHNLHVCTYSRWMGNHLDNYYGNEMIVFGFCFHEGEYTAVGDGGLKSYTTSDSEAGSIEWEFHRTGYPRLMLDLNLVNSEDPNSSWLSDRIAIRNIGAREMQYAFQYYTIPQLFDVLIFFDHSSASDCFNSSSQPDLNLEEELSK